jgi:hypothetical protein
MVELAELIQRAWPIFREAIRMCRTLSYSELAGRVGPPVTCRQVHRQLLIPLAARCHRAGLPNLAALVVRKDTGLPGAGWFEPRAAASPEAAWADALAECFAYAWPPQPDPRLLAP